MAVLAGVIHASVLVTWLVSPVVLAVAALLSWRRNCHHIHWRVVPLTIAALILILWSQFIVSVVRAQTLYGMYYQTSSLTDVLLIASVIVFLASATASAGKWKLFAASLLLVSLWIGVIYAPAHWLERIDLGEVTLNEHHVPATVFIGHPTDMEAEAIALVHTSTAGDYFFDFGSEKVRTAGTHEYLRLPGGAWCFRSVRGMRFVEPLPSQRVNEFRVASLNGGILSWRF
jgi:hypothetical protein